MTVVKCLHEGFVLVFCTHACMMWLKQLKATCRMFTSSSKPESSVMISYTICKVVFLIHEVKYHITKFKNALGIRVGKVVRTLSSKKNSQMVNDFVLSACYCPTGNKKRPGSWSTVGRVGYSVIVCLVIAFPALSAYMLRCAWAKHWTPNISLWRKALKSLNWLSSA